MTATKFVAQYHDRMVRFTMGVLRNASDWQEGQDALANHQAFGPYLRDLYGDDDGAIITEMQNIIREAEERLGEALPY
jgi:hypothetical protein